MYYIPVVKLSMVRDSTLKTDVKQVESSAAASQIVSQYLQGADREHFVVLLLDGRHKVLGINTVSIGTLTASLVHPREVFKPAIMSNCAAVIVAHNHPSGEPSPSREDHEITKRLCEAGKLLGVPVLDHLIVTDDPARYFSFGDHRVLPTV